MYEIHICPESEALTIRKKTKEQAKRTVAEYYPIARFHDITNKDLAIYNGKDYVGSILYKYPYYIDGWFNVEAYEEYIKHEKSINTI